MANENRRLLYTVYDYSLYDTTIIPAEGERRYFDTIITGQVFPCSVLGDGGSMVEELPFLETLYISTGANVDLSDLRIHGNRVQVYNSGAGAITINVGTAGVPVNFSIVVGGRAGFEFVVSDWMACLYNSASVNKGTGLWTFDNAILLPKKTITSDSDAEDVAGISILKVNTNGGNITLGGLANGTANQPLFIYKSVLANVLTIEHNEATGTQKFFTEDTNDIILNNYGGSTFICDGIYWFEVKH